MKKLAIALVPLLAAILFDGCKKEESTPPPAPPAPTQSVQEKPAALVSNAVSAVSEAPAVPKSIETPKAAADTAAETVKSTATTQTNAVADASQSLIVADASQSLIDRAKSYITDGKYQDALASLQKLDSSKLTSDQQGVVAKLKDQIQAALTKSVTSDPSSVLGGALPGKK